MLTDELRLRLPVSLRNIPAVAACPAGVPGINQENRYPRQLSFIGNKAPKLTESPLAQSFPLALSNRDPKPFQVLKGNSPSGVFGQLDKLLSNGVIDIFLKSSFSAGQLFKVPLGRFRTAFLKGSFELGCAFSNFINLLASECLAVRSGNKIDNSEVNSKNPLRVNRFTVRDFYHQAKVKVSFLINQVGLASYSALLKFGVRAKDNGDFQSAVKSKNGDQVKSLERKNAAVIDNSGTELENVQSLFSAL